MGINDYRIRRYSYKAFEILKRRTVESGKNEGEEVWEPFKYPGSLEAAAKGLLQLDIPEDEEMSVEELIAAVQQAEKNVLRALEGSLLATEEN